MTMVEYLKILKEEVSQWPSSAVLEEDGAAGHGRNKNSPVSKWKKDHHVKYYFNYLYSPDLAPIENAWIAPKSYLRKQAHWTEEMVQEVACDGWYAITEKKRRYWCDTMPQRLRDVIRLKGQMTAW